MRFGLTPRLQIWCGLGVLLLGVAVRLPQLGQSLWYDEMTTLVEYVIGPWSKILAAGPGDYVPNNHVLHTIFVKLIYSLGGNVQVVPPREAMLRLPAFFAGLMVPFALVWPLRQSDPLLALGLAIITMLHPWLVASSVEARGYSLLLLLGILSTNCLIERPIAYVLSLAMAIYTVPLAVLLIPAHAVTIIVLRRSDFVRWLIGAIAAVTLAGVMYLPMYRGLISYYSHPYAPTMNYRQFLDWLPRYAMAGVRLPTSADSLALPATGAIYWALPVLGIVFGSIVGWSRVALRPILLTVGFATIFGIILPLIDAGATEVRFVPWVMLWFCVTIAGGLLTFFSGNKYDREVAKTRRETRRESIPGNDSGGFETVSSSRLSSRLRAFAVEWFGADRRPTEKIGKIAGLLGLVTLISWQMLQDISMPPNQPIREGIQLADRVVPPGRAILVLYLGARESIALYGQTRHELLAGPDALTMMQMQKKSLADTGHLPWILIYFEQLARDRDLGPAETRGMWTNLMTNYHLAGPRIPARLTPIAIYAPNEKPMAGRP